MYSVDAYMYSVDAYMYIFFNSSFIAGEITVAKILDREEKSSYNLIVQAYIIQII